MTESLRIRPHYLAYFNQIVGGPQNGWRHLVDSSLDWGQDLPGLKRWIDAHAQGEQVFLSYFGTGAPTYEGIKAISLPALPEVGPSRKWHALSPGVYAISATMLQHVYSRVRGKWSLEFENEYQELRRLENTLLLYQNDPAQRSILLNDAPAENWVAAWKRYEQLRFARLCHYLRAKTADASVGHSILIFRLDEAELEGAVGDSLAEWSRLIEHAIKQRHAVTPGRAAMNVSPRQALESSRYRPFAFSHIKRGRADSDQSAQAHPARTETLLREGFELKTLRQMILRIHHAVTISRCGTDHLRYQHLAKRAVAHMPVDLRSAILRQISVKRRDLFE
jgi:hypothetical protein